MNSSSYTNYLAKNATFVLINFIYEINYIDDKKTEIIEVINTRKYPVISYKEYYGITLKIKELWGHKSMSKSKITQILKRENIIKEEKLTSSTKDTRVYIKLDCSFDIFDIASFNLRI